MDKKRKYGRRYCVAFGCLNSNRNTPDLTFFSLPKDAERRREWLISIGREDLLSKANLRAKSYEVCSEHFEHSAIRTIKQLKTNAIPTKLIVSENRVPDDQHSTSKEVKPTGVSPQSETVTVKKATPVSTSTQTESLKAVTVKKATFVSTSTQTESLKTVTVKKATFVSTSTQTESLKTVTVNKATFVSTSTQTESLKTENEESQTTKALTDKTPRKCLVNSAKRTGADCLAHELSE